MRKTFLTVLFTALITCAVLYFLNLLSFKTSETGMIDKPDGTLAPKEATALSTNFVNYTQAYEDIAERYFDIIERCKEMDITQSKRFQNPSTALLNRVVQKEQDDPIARPTFKLSASSSYTLKELDTYMKYASQQADSLGYDLNGFRFYFGVFPKDKKKYNTKSDELTMFISPTGVKRETQQGNMFPTTLVQDGDGDILGIVLKEYGGTGNPPRATYPQQ